MTKSDYKFLDWRQIKSSKHSKMSLFLNDCLIWMNLCRLLNILSFQIASIPLEESESDDESSEEDDEMETDDPVSYHFYK